MENKWWSNGSVALRRAKMARLKNEKKVIDLILPKVSDNDFLKNGDNFLCIEQL